MGILLGRKGRIGQYYICNLIPHDFPEGLHHVATRQSKRLAEIVDELPLVSDRAMCSADVED
jgi:hypothetical protein